MTKKFPRSIRPKHIRLVSIKNINGKGNPLNCLGITATAVVMDTEDIGDIATRKDRNISKAQFGLFICFNFLIFAFNFVVE